MCFELELVVAALSASGTRQILPLFRGASLSAESRIAGRIMTTPARRLLLSVSSRAEVEQLDIFEIAGPDHVPVVMRHEGARLEHVVDMVRDLVAAARAHVTEDVINGVYQLRIVFPVLVLPTAVLECSHRRTGALTMIERDEATLAWPDVESASGERALVQLVRDRVFPSYVKRARGAFEYLCRHHRREIERADRS